MSFAKSDNFNLDLDLLSGFEFFDTIKNLDLDFTGSTDLDSDCKKIRYLPPNLIKPTKKMPSSPGACHPP